MEEFWGARDTTIHFCEDAYKKSNYIAEYYNSLSGLSYSLVGIYFLNTKFKNISYTLISFIQKYQSWEDRDEISLNDAVDRFLMMY